MAANKLSGEHEGHRQRMKERLHRDGLTGFEEHEVLEMLLFYALPYRNTNGLGHKLIDRFGSLANVLDADYADLCKTDGITPHVATLLTLSGQIAHRYIREQYDIGTILYTTADRGRCVLPLFVGKKEECVVLVSMDSRHKLINATCLYHGSVNSVQFSFRTVIQQALQDNATIVFLAHNHPRGFAFPSNADIETTARFADALKVVGIRLIDHLIVADGDFVSLADTPETAALFENKT